MKTVFKLVCLYLVFEIIELIIAKAVLMVGLVVASVVAVLAAGFGIFTYLRHTKAREVTR